MEVGRDDVNMVNKIDARAKYKFKWYWPQSKDRVVLSLDPAGGLGCLQALDKISGLGSGNPLASLISDFVTLYGVVSNSDISQHSSISCIGHTILGD